ncbi:UGSC family (seleno)protein [Mycobacterium camsae]|uniref:UGSC family (seleno)protein n=1 Tax=Mycobacterium gordonae TaxID=1778 RepID=UPI00197D74E7|nr:hypothetical protein [Mycobacterium gordonae]
MQEPYATCEVVKMPLISTAPRRSSFDSLRLGVLCNTKWNAAKLLLLTVRQLVDHGLSLATVNYYDKAHFSCNAGSESVAEIAADNDIALTAIGDCAWSYSACISDALHLERAGVPTVAFVTSEFELEALLQCELLGMPGLTPGVTEHPISSLTTEQLQSCAAKMASQARRIWFGADGALEAAMFEAGAGR